ncbi:MAG TPA: SDR family oxidoreductase, partial [Lacipirellulaceae bacterium]|nr:SDR family oxidoreductase [Lacipirellulaceae bacterium]
DDMQLKDKVILVTGSTTGIGEAIARRSCQEGASVVLHGRDAKRGLALAAELGARTAFFPGDLADPKVPAKLVKGALSKFDRLDAIVNNAARVVRSDIHTTDVALFDNVMATNVRAPMLVIQAALPHLLRSRGCVLNIGSMNAYTGESNLLAYSVSKGALMTLSRNLADALCYDGVRVNHFNVGWVLTPNEYQYKVNDGLPPDWPEKIPPQFAPMGRIMKPEEIAAAAVYWLSDESRPFSGAVVDLEQYPFVGRNPTKRGD